MCAFDVSLVPHLQVWAMSSVKYLCDPNEID